MEHKERRKNIEKERKSGVIQRVRKKERRMKEREMKERGMIEG